MSELREEDTPLERTQSGDQGKRRDRSGGWETAEPAAALDAGVDDAPAQKEQRSDPEEQRAATVGPEGSAEEDEDPTEVLEDLLAEIADGLALDVEIEIEESAGVLKAELYGDDMGRLIGRRGQTIDAVQHLAQRIVFHDGPADVRVVIDANGYREQRAEALRADADRAAAESLRSGRPVELDPMPASERRVVHEHLRDREDVETHSEGEEPERRLVVSPLSA